MLAPFAGPGGSAAPEVALTAARVRGLLLPLLCEASAGAETESESDAHMRALLVACTPDAGTLTEALRYAAGRMATEAAEDAAAALSATRLLLAAAAGEARLTRGAVAAAMGDSGAAAALQRLAAAGSSSPRVAAMADRLLRQAWAPPLPTPREPEDGQEDGAVLLVRSALDVPTLPKQGAVSRVAAGDVSAGGGAELLHCYALAADMRPALLEASLACLLTDSAGERVEALHTLSSSVRTQPAAEPEPKHEEKDEPAALAQAQAQEPEAEQGQQRLQHVSALEAGHAQELDSAPAAAEEVLSLSLMLGLAASADADCSEAALTALEACNKACAPTAVGPKPVQTRTGAAVPDAAFLALVSATLAEAAPAGAAAACAARWARLAHPVERAQMAGRAGQAGRVALGAKTSAHQAMLRGLLQAACSMGGPRAQAAADAAVEALLQQQELAAQEAPPRAPGGEGGESDEGGEGPAGSADAEAAAARFWHGQRGAARTLALICGASPHAAGCLVQDGTLLSHLVELALDDCRAGAGATQAAVASRPNAGSRALHGALQLGGHGATAAAALIGQLLMKGLLRPRQHAAAPRAASPAEAASPRRLGGFGLGRAPAAPRTASTLRLDEDTAALLAHCLRSAATVCACLRPAAGRLMEVKAETEPAATTLQALQALREVLQAAERGGAYAIPLDLELHHAFW